MILGAAILVAILMIVAYLYGFDDGFQDALRECATNHKLEITHENKTAD